MKNLILPIFTALLLTSCLTTNNPEPIKPASKSVSKPEESVTDNGTQEAFDEEQILIKQDLTLTIIESIDPTYGEFAYSLLELINNKDWETISKFTDPESYNNYVVESHGSHEDYCMFIFDTAYKGASTEYSLNQIDQAFYYNYYLTDNILTLEGEYIYPTGEVEFFRVSLLNDGEEVIITRD